MIVLPLLLTFIPGYAITDLGIEYVERAFLNDRGTVAGMRRLYDPVRTEPFLRQGGRLRDLSESVLQIRSLNNRDQLAVVVAGGGARWTKGKIERSTQSPSAVAGIPVGIDDDGNVEFIFGGVEGTFSAWSWPGKLEHGGIYPTVVGADGTVSGISAWGRRFGQKGPTGFIFVAGRTQPIGESSTLAFPRTISPEHVVGGDYSSPETTWKRPFLWKNGIFQPLRVPPREQTYGSVTGVNDRGEAVGTLSWVVEESEYSHIGHHSGVLWKNGEFYDLNDLVPKAPAYHIQEALAINAGGVILVSAQLVQHPFPARLLLLDPR